MKSNYNGLRVIQERNSANTPPVSYTRGSDLSGTLEGAGGIGGLLGRANGYSGGNWSTHNVYHADGNGNITYLLNSSQSKVAEYRYDPFGNTISSSGMLAAANVYRFSSKELHVTSGLYYYTHRFYSPNLQRWPNQDPIADLGFIILTHQFTLRGGAEPNIYTFVGNNAVGNVDGRGLTIYYCTVPTSSFPTLGIGRHAYLWDDRLGISDDQRECGQESSCGSSGHSSNNTGPGGLKPQASGTICIAVPGSEGNEPAIMADCATNANSGIWFPGINDCHNKVQRCLRRNGLTPPDNPRFPGPFIPNPLLPGPGRFPVAY